MAGAPAVTVTEGGVDWQGAAQTLKSVTVKNVEALFWVDEPFAVTMPLLARVTASVGVRITVTVAVAPTLSVPMAHVMLAGVPVGLVQDAPVEAVTELKVAFVVGSVSVNVTADAVSGPLLLVIVYVKVAWLPTPTVGVPPTVGVAATLISTSLREPSLATKASLLPFIGAPWKGLANGKSDEKVSPAT